MRNISRILFVLISLLLLASCHSSDSGSSGSSGSGGYNIVVSDDHGGIVRVGQPNTLHVQIKSAANFNSKQTDSLSAQSFDISVTDQNTTNPLALTPATTNVALGGTASIQIAASETVASHELTITVTQSGNSIGVKNYHINVDPPITESGKLYYHFGFPVTSLGTEYIDLSNPVYTNLILSNYVAGVLYGHMLQESNNVPNFTSEQKYLYGSLFAQLLQENVATESYDGGDFINSASTRANLLKPGQGGPYQINNYSVRIPAVGVPGAAGLINYTALQAQLGYTISDQDTGSQTHKTGPQELDNVYFGPIAAAYFHYNDWNSLQISPPANWAACLANLKAGNFSYLDMIMNADYNAGQQSDILKTYVELCSSPGSYATEVAGIDDYSLSDSAYINLFAGLSNALPSSYVGKTFVVYPRQVRFYLDQLYSDNAALKTSGYTVNNQFAVTLQNVRSVFAQSMAKLAYVPVAPGGYSYITINQADAAFDSALASNNTVAVTSIRFASQADLDIMYKVLDAAFTNLENSLNFQFNDTTETDHTIGA